MRIDPLYIKRDLTRLLSLRFKLYYQVKKQIMFRFPCFLFFALLLCKPCESNWGSVTSFFSGAAETAKNTFTATAEMIKESPAVVGLTNLVASAGKTEAGKERML